MRKLILLFLIDIFAFAALKCSKDSAADMAAAPSSNGVGGSLARFTIVGNYLYAVDNSNLKVFSILNPADPVLKKTIEVGFEIETIYPFRDKLFIGSTSVIHIFSTDDPENPQKLSTAISPNVIRRCDPVVAKDSVAYATLRTNGTCGGTLSLLVAFDIKDISNPVQKTSRLISEPYGLGYSDTVLYVCDRNGLTLFNIKSAYNPQFIKAILGDWFIDVIPYYNTLICWVSNGVILYDISDRSAPQFIAKLM